jgi:peptidoglycan hydrolase CwlO-like protein
MIQSQALLSLYTAFSVLLKCLKGTGRRDKRDSIFVPHRKALYDVNALSVKHKVVISSIIHYKNHSMAHLAEQMTMNNNVQGSIPNSSTSSSRVLHFLESIARNTHSESTAIDRKIAQLKAQRERLRENAKKIKQRIREQTEKLRLIEQEIDNIDLNVTKLQDIQEDDEIDLK